MSLNATFLIMSLVEVSIVKLGAFGGSQDQADARRGEISTFKAIHIQFLGAK
jgi:ABC-type cobalt transport system substrate-binding protein